MSLLDKLLIALGWKKKPEPVVDTWTPPPAPIPSYAVPRGTVNTSPAPTPLPTAAPIAPPPAPAPAPSPAPIAVQEAPPKKKRGRPAKAK